MRVEACERHRSGAQSDLLYERRASCLEQRRGDLAALVDVYRAADRDVVAKAACADADALLAEVTPPATAEAAAEAERLRGELATGRADLATGRAKQAKDKLARLTPAIAATGYRPLIAEAGFLAGNAEQLLGDAKAAAATYEAALWAAEASRHDLVAAESAIRLLTVVGYQLARVDESGVWERRHGARAARRRRRLLGDKHTDTANSEANLGDTLLRLGRPEQALGHAERALAGHLASVGDKHGRYGGLTPVGHPW